MATVRYDFRGTKVLVTGGSRGIGRAVATAFAAAGADVTILAVGTDVSVTADEISRAAGHAVSALTCDITSSQDVDAAMSAVAQIDELVNNAGLELLTPIDAGGPDGEESFRRVVDINVIGTYLVTRAALPKLAAGGRIIITASIWGRVGFPQFSAYCASKHANLGFMRALAKELAPRDINVNAVCPGWVRTDASLRSLSEISRRGDQSEAEVLQEISDGQIIPGLMTPEDVAPIYLFLASDGARNVTGQAWNVDRGEVMS